MSDFAVSNSSRCKQIDRITDEILKSEIQYRNSLYKILVNYKPVVNGNRRLSTSQLSTLFDILEDICCLTSDLLLSLQGTRYDLSAFAQCFILREQQILFLYSDYCSTLTGATDTLSRILQKDKLAVMLQQIQLEGRHELPLSAELLKPFQHLFTYELLLDKLYKAVRSAHTDSAHVSSRMNEFSPMPAKGANTQGTCTIIGSAMGRIRIILDQINELKRMNENKTRLKELQNGGLKLVGDLQLSEQGDLLFESTVQQTNKSVLRHLILLKKCLLVCKKYFSFLVAKHVLMTSSLVLESDPYQSGSAENSKCFALYESTSHQRFEFMANSAEQKRIWLKYLRVAIKPKAVCVHCTMEDSPCMLQSLQEQYRGSLPSTPKSCSNETNCFEDKNGQSVIHSWPLVGSNTKKTKSIVGNSKSKTDLPPRRTNSVSNQRGGRLKSFRRSVTHQLLGSAPQLNEDDDPDNPESKASKNGQLCVRTELLPPSTSKQIVSAHPIEGSPDLNGYQRKSILRVYSFKRYVDAVAMPVTIPDALRLKDQSLVIGPSRGRRSVTSGNGPKHVQIANA